MTVHWLVVSTPNEYDSEPSYELFATEDEAKFFAASQPHFVDTKIVPLREGENT